MTTLLEPSLLEPTLHLITPAEACQAWNRGAVVVDLRTDAERQADGPLIGSVPAHGWSDGPAILLCQDGLRSAELASSLGGQGAGSEPVMVVAGGYTAWRRAVWRDWGELLIAEPTADVGRFFRLLRSDRP